MANSFRIQSNWKRWTQPWQHFDWLLLAMPTALTIFASIVIASTQLNQDATIFGWNHFFLGMIGIGITLWVARIRYEVLLQWQWI
ncbi:MAG: rod shape-determining protein RodA, partial [Cyanobacteria bacterium P01_C01_bin.70]